ncbi:phosphocarrier protein HPr [Sporosarcina sp. ANT_H38]|uniref:phosphocarrier protein HPr n=1 Tax=Sporosarcina sp. ANT_H38 TaxID=2597358 RepID=UPI0011F19979|nr:phosphocarrier protein HPr [Sporosarcina sp. ANT_H38]KAA0964959.1 phosphocarrier protein HPr [Sporosarcina sp. ANT_H38]
MIEKQYTILGTAGLHARPTSALVSAVSSFKSDITLEYVGKKVNLKSILGVMSLGVASGTIITIAADGEDETDAIAKVDSIMESEGLGK